MSTKTKKNAPTHPIGGKLVKELEYQSKKARLQSKIFDLEYQKLKKNKPHGNLNNYEEKYVEWAEKCETSLSNQKNCLGTQSKCLDLENLIILENALFLIHDLLDDGRIDNAKELADNRRSSLSSWVEFKRKDLEVLND